MNKRFFQKTVTLIGFNNSYIKDISNFNDIIALGKKEGDESTIKNIEAKKDVLFLIKKGGNNQRDIIHLGFDEHGKKSELNKDYYSSVSNWLPLAANKKT